MVHFKTSQIDKLTVNQINELLGLYAKAEFTATIPENPKKPDLLNALRIVLEKAGGYPHVVTEEWLAENNILPESGMEVGDVIIVPFPTPEEELRTALLYDAEMYLADHPDREAIYAELEAMPTERLQVKVREVMKKEHEDAKNPPAAPTVPQATETPAEVKNDSVAATVSADPIADAIATGKMRHENQTIIGYNARIANGRIKFDLYASNGATYLVTKEEMDALVANTK